MKLMKILVVAYSVVILCASGSLVYYLHNSGQVGVVRDGINLTREELRQMPQRETRAFLYRQELSNDAIPALDETPYDILQQYIYDKQQDKVCNYTVTLYRTTTLLDNPSWRDCLDLAPVLQYTQATLDTDIPTVIKDNLSFGYHSVTMEGTNYIMEVLYNDIDLDNWESSQIVLNMLKEER